MFLRSFGFALVFAMAAFPAGAVDLRYGSKGLPTSFGNPYTGNGSPGIYLWSAMYDGLTRLDKNGAIAPALATSWKSLSPTAWQFTLRKNVTFSNGEPFDAAAVIAAINWLKSPEANIKGAIVANEIRGISKAEPGEDGAVIIHTTRPDPILPARLSSMMIPAPTAWRELGVDEFAKSPSGTGPFHVKDWGGTAKITLEAFAQSWRKPKVDRLIIINLPDNSTRVQALQSGQIDIAGNIGVDDIDTLEAAGMISAVGPAMSVMSMGLRVEGGINPALKDVRVRQALNYAIDKAAINQALLRGLSPPSGQPAARDVVGYNPDVKPYPYDPAKAKALLAEAGYPNGFPMNFEVMVDRTPGDRGVFESIASQLGKIGVPTTMKIITFGSWMESYLGGTWDKETDGFVLSFNAAPYNDVARPMEIYSCLRPNGFFCDKAVTAKLVTSNEETNADKRLAQLGELAKLFHDAAPAIYLGEQFDVFGVTKKLEGFAIANRAPIYENISVKK